MRLCLGVVLVALAATAHADDAAERQAILTTIDAFFAALAERDTEGMRDTMTETGEIRGYRESAEGLQVMRRTFAEYVDGIDGGDGVLLERYWEPTVMVYERLATAWTPYDFHVDGMFSHCGVNNFSFLKTDSGWRIAGVVFSIETDTCEPSPLGPVAGDSME